MDVSFCNQTTAPKIRIKSLGYLREYKTMRGNFYQRTSESNKSLPQEY